MSGTPRRYKRYPAYKDSGVEWLGEIPADWKVKRLRSTVTACQNGVWGDESDGKNDIACVRVADFDRTAFRVTDIPTIRSVEPRIVETRGLRRGDLLLEKSGGGENQPVGTVVLYDLAEPAICSNFIARMPVASGFDARFLTFLHAAIYASRINTKSIKQNTGIQNLDSASYLNEVAAFPNFEEQRCIAGFLDREVTRIDALVTKKERLIELLEEKRSAFITGAVTKGLDPSVPMKDSGVGWLGRIPAHWETTKLKFASARIVDCPHETPTYSDIGEHFVVRTSDVNDGVLDLSLARRVDDREYQTRIRRLSLRVNDIVYSREGERFGHAALLPPGVSACLGQRMMQFRVSKGWNHGFLMWQLNARSVYQQAALDTAGATSPHVNVDTVRNFFLGEPPLYEQTAIASQIDADTRALDRLLGNIRLGIDVMNEFRTTLISAAATGKVDVREEPA